MANANPTLTIKAQTLIKLLLDELDCREILSLMIDELAERKKDPTFKYQKLTLTYQMQLLKYARDDLKELVK